MNKIFRNFFLTLALVFASFATHAIISPTPTFAAGCDNAIFGLDPWNCNVGDINAIKSTDALSNAIWTIAGNIATDLTVLAAYLVLGFVIYGGYLYIFAAGDPSKVAAGKKTLSQAFIGLAIVMSANIILNTIRIALGNASFSKNCATLTGAPPAGCMNITDTGTMVTNAIQWVVGIAGLIAVIFVVYGAVAYITSAGDAGRAAKAKNVIVYSLIGLAIVALAEIGTAFVSNLIRQSTSSGGGGGGGTPTSYLVPTSPETHLLPSADASTSPQATSPTNFAHNFTNLIHERNHYV